MQPTTRQLEAMRMLGIGEEEWQFTIGRYLEARKELESLRMGVARIAEHLHLQESIPGYCDDVHLFNAVKHIERGWNKLCAEIINEIEAGPKLCEECGIYPADPPSKVCPGCEAYREHQK